MQLRIIEQCQRETRKVADHANNIRPIEIGIKFVLSKIKSLDVSGAFACSTFISIFFSGS